MLVLDVNIPLQAAAIMMLVLLILVILRLVVFTLHLLVMIKTPVLMTIAILQLVV
jgi:hypothetical protein